MDEQSGQAAGTTPSRRAAGRRRRVRASVAFWVTVSLVLVGVAATSGSGGAVPDLGFRQVGHWVYSGTLGKVFHVNGATKTIDAAGDVEGGRLAGGPAVQSPTSVYVPGEGGTTIEFGKSRLKVKAVQPSGVNELPFPLEVSGGPYYVYRQSGIIQRLSPLATIRLGGSLGDPVATSDGTVWVVRQTDGAVCSLGRADTEASCPDRVPAGHRGAVTVIADRPAVVDTTSAELRRIDADGLGPAMPLGTRLGDDARVAPADAAGKLPVVRPADRSLLLIDTTRLAPGREPGAPRTVKLDSDDVSTPAAAGGAVAVVDQRNDKLVTYDVEGARIAATDLPAGSTVRLSRAQDGRVYADVDGTTDRAVVVDGTGEINEVPLTDPVPGSSPSTAPRQPGPTTPPATPTPTPTTPPAEPTEAPEPPEPTEPPDTQAPEPTEAPEPPEPTERPEPPEPSEPSATTRPPGPPGPPAPTGTTPRRPTVPGAPRTVEATASGTGATLTWQAGPTNGAAITAYLVSWRTVSAGAVVSSATLPGTSLRTTVSGLSAGVSYVASVAAENRAGRGVAAESNPVTPQPAGPGAPTGVRATANGADGSVTVTFQAAAGGGTAATGYVVTANSGGSQRVTSRQAVFRTLPVGTRHTFTVAAVDAQGATGPPSAASNAVTPYRPAGAPGAVRATRGDRSATLTWTAPALNGGALAGYRVAAAGLAARTVTGTTATVDGLTAGQAYSFTVRAVTREQGGDGPTVDGAASAAVPVTAVGVPRIDVVSAERAGGGVTVVAQVDDGGSAMTSCRVIIGTQSFPGLRCQAGRSTFQLDTTPAGTPMVTAAGTNAIGTGQPGQGQQLTPPPAASVPDGTYRLRQGSPSGDTVEVAECETADESALRMWSRVAGSSDHCQRWTVTSLGGGTYRIVKADSSQALDACSSSTPWLFGYSGRSCQQWRITSAGGGGYTLSVASSGQALQPEGCSTSNGAGVRVAAPTGSSCQTWYFEDT